MKTIFSLLFLLSSIICWSQNNILKRFSLEENPTLHKVESQYSEESLVYIKDYRAVNIFEDYSGPHEIRTYHRIMRVQDNIGVSFANTIELELDKYEEVLSIKVRTISAEGKVMTFDNQDYKEITNEDGSTTIKIAVKGLEVNGEVEYLYSLSRSMNYFSRLYYYSEYPIQDLTFELFFSKFGFFVKSYNELPAPRLTDRSIICEAKNINPLSEEGLSNFISKINRIDYKLNEVGISKETEVWGKISRYYVDLLKFMKGKGKVNKFLETLDLKDKSIEAQIFAVEDAIKKKIVLENSTAESYSNVKSILKTGIANNVGLFKLFASCFSSLGIKMDIVMACSRFNGKIDEAFAHPWDLEIPVLYFPEIDKYLSTTNKITRLGFPSYLIGSSRGLAIKTKVTSYGSVYDYVSHNFVTLPIIKPQYNTEQIKIGAKLNASKDELVLKYHSKTKGYKAFSKRFLKNKNENDYAIIEDIQDLKIIDSKFTNTEFVHSTDHKTPFIVDADLQSKSLVQILENDILIDLGKLIGTRTEPKKIKNRTNDIIIPYPKLTEYKIDFEIPKGYKCEGLENLNQNTYYNYEHGESIKFKVIYELIGNVLKLTVYEGYNSLLVKKEHFSDFINIQKAASDFSNFTLVLEKE